MFRSVCSSSAGNFSRRLVRNSSFSLYSICSQLDFICKTSGEQYPLVPLMSSFVIGFKVLPSLLYTISTRLLISATFFGAFVWRHCYQKYNSFREWYRIGHFSKSIIEPWNKALPWLLVWTGSAQISTPFLLHTSSLNDFNKSELNAVSSCWLSANSGRRLWRLLSHCLGQILLTSCDCRPNQIQSPFTIFINNLRFTPQLQCPLHMFATHWSQCNIKGVILYSAPQG